MKKSFYSVLLVTLVIVAPSLSSAQLLVDHQSRAGNQKLDISAALVLSEIEYEREGDGTVDIDRTILGASLGYGITPTLDVYGELGYILDAEIEETSGDDGILFGGGLRAVLFRQDKFNLRGRGGMRVIVEDYGNGAEGKVAELDLGLVGRYTASDKVGVYGGLDLVPFSDGELDVRNRDQNLERDNLIGLRFGADWQLDGVALNAEVALISEEALILRLTFPLG